MQPDRLRILLPAISPLYRLLLSEYIKKINSYITMILLIFPKTLPAPTSIPCLRLMAM